MTTQEIKEQAREEFEKEFTETELDNHYSSKENWKIPKGVPCHVKSFIDSLIDKTVQMERDRIVGIVGFVDEEFLAQPDAEKYVGEWSINKDRQRILSLITNKSNINN